MLCALSQEIKGAAGSSALVLDNKADRRDSNITSQNAPPWICCAIPDFDPSKQFTCRHTLRFRSASQRELPELISSHRSASYYLPDGLLTTKVAVHDTTSHPSALYGSPLPQLDMSDPATLLPIHNVASLSDPLLRVQPSLFRLPSPAFHLLFHRAGHGSRRLSMGNGEICRMSRRGERHRRRH